MPAPRLPSGSGSLAPAPRGAAWGGPACFFSRLFSSGGSRGFQADGESKPQRENHDFIWPQLHVSPPPFHPRQKTNHRWCLGESRTLLLRKKPLAGLGDPGLLLILCQPRSPVKRRWGGQYPPIVRIITVADTVRSKHSGWTLYPIL